MITQNRFTSGRPVSFLSQESVTDALSLFRVLFDEGDSIAMGINGAMVQNDYTPRDASMILQGIPLSSHVPLPPQDFSLSGMLVCINPATTTGNNGVSNATVESYRTFLFELDAGTLADQRNFWDATGMPHSAIVYTGGKSLHVLVTLDKPMPTLQMYQAIHRTIVQRLHLKFGVRADADTNHPNRTTKIPGFLRPSKDDSPDKPAKLVRLAQRVKKDDFMAWATSIGVTPAMVKLNYQEPKRQWEGSLRKA